MTLHSSVPAQYHGVWQQKQIYSETKGQQDRRWNAEKPSATLDP